MADSMIALSAQVSSERSALVVVVHVQRAYAPAAVAGCTRWRPWVKDHEFESISSLGLLTELAHVVHISLLSLPVTAACKGAVVIV